MDRQRPDTTSNEIDLYIRTYYSLLRSTGEVRVRSFEEAHAYSQSSLHLGARDSRPDVSAFGYAAARLPDCMPEVQNLVLGQSEDQFEGFGYDVRRWQTVRAPGRRRPLRYDGERTVAAFIASASDIDDLVPIATAYQIEWNKIHTLLGHSEAGASLATAEHQGGEDFERALADSLSLGLDALSLLKLALGKDFVGALETIASRPCDLRMHLIAGSFSQYQRSCQRWWGGVEPIYLRSQRPRRRPVYFVSSNTHSLANLLGGYALENREILLQTAKQDFKDSLGKKLEAALAENDEDAANLLYFTLREHLHAHPEGVDEIQAWDAESGIHTVPDPGHVEVSAQVIEVAKIRPERCDPRVVVPGLSRLRGSDAVIVNIDYPLGMAAYQLLSRVGHGVGAFRGIYVMGKAATLNGRVGDVMISCIIHDEHSKNTYMFQNPFSAGDVAPYLGFGSVLDHQKALTVRSAFLQNRQYLGVFYKDGYTVMEMEGGPYLSAVYELVDPRRHPRDGVINLSGRAPFDVGILHYASDTPYSRRKELLSKSLGYFGMDATYACAIAITRRILAQEVALAS